MADVKMCPKCGSTDLKNVKPYNNVTVYSAQVAADIQKKIKKSYSGSKYDFHVLYCKTCGYYGTCILVPDINIKKVQDEIKNLNQEKEF